MKEKNIGGNKYNLTWSWVEGKEIFPSLCDLTSMIFSFIDDLYKPIFFWSFGGGASVSHKYVISVHPYILMPKHKIQFMMFQMFVNQHAIVEQQISNLVKGWVTRLDSNMHSLAFPCMDPAMAPGTSLLERELAMRPVPADLAGDFAVHALEWCLNALGTKRRWQCGHCSKLCSKAANALYRNARWPLDLASYSIRLRPKNFFSRSHFIHDFICSKNAHKSIWIVLESYFGINV